MAIKKYTKEEIKKMEDKTDYDRVKNTTEEEMRKNASSDPDALLQSKEDLESFRPAKRRGTKNENSKKYLSKIAEDKIHYNEMIKIV